VRIQIKNENIKERVRMQRPKRKINKMQKGREEKMYKTQKGREKGKSKEVSGSREQEKEERKAS